MTSDATRTCAGIETRQQLLLECSTSTYATRMRAGIETDLPSSFAHCSTDATRMCAGIEKRARQVMCLLSGDVTRTRAGIGTRILGL